MKTKFLLFISSLGFAIGLTSCSLTQPIAATANPVGKKVGHSQAMGILMFPPFIGKGNSGIQKAAEDGKISQISTVDFTTNYFILWNTKVCTVTGN